MKKILSFILSFVVSAALLSGVSGIVRANAGTDLYDYCEDGIFYKIMMDSDSLMVTGFDRTDKKEKVIIPEKIDGKKVEAIGSNAFSANAALKEIFLPKTIKSIGFWAFGYCRNLERIFIPKSVTSIEESAFDTHGHLYVEVEEGNPSYASLDGALYDKGFTIILCYTCAEGKVVLPATVTTIGEACFQGCGGFCSEDYVCRKEPLDIDLVNSSVSHVKAFAFSDTVMAPELTLPECTLDSYAIVSDSLETINMPKSVIFDSASNGAMLLNTERETVINIGKDCIVESDGFSQISGYIHYNVDKDNENFMGEDGVLYSKDGSALISYGKDSEEIFMREGVQWIADKAIHTPYSCDEIAIHLSKSLKSFSMSSIKVEDYTLKKLNIYDNGGLEECDLKKADALIKSGIEPKFYCYLNSELYKSCMELGMRKHIVLISESGIYGDVNHDGEIDSKDALAILKYDVGIEQKVFIEEVADADNDGKITAKDALIILKYDVGILKEFPLEYMERIT